MENKNVVSASPHLTSPGDTAKIMWLVTVCLLPTAVASVVMFGIHSLVIIATSVATCIGVEYISNIVFRKKQTIADGSAAVTGILFAFTLPPTTPFWMVIAGGVLAIFIVKQLFGGLGFNIFNPALAARAILLASFPVALTTWTIPTFPFAALFGGTPVPDATTAASALGIIKEASRVGASATAQPYGYVDLLFGAIPGSLGETCKITLLVGAALLLLVRIIDWRVPLAFIGTVALLSIPFGRDPLREVLSGGLILGAFFMATDMVTSPTTKLGKFIFGMGCGIMTALIRSWGGFPEGVCYSILLMNCLNPLIEKYIRPKVFGSQTGLFGKKTALAETKTA